MTESLCTGSDAFIRLYVVLRDREAVAVTLRVAQGQAEAAQEAQSDLS
jgi:hypothetical protein